MYTAADHTFAICAYKESPYLADCVASLLAQSDPSNILIATSTPNDTISALAEETGIPLYVREGTPGIGVDWNHALRRATTPLVTIAHQDDWYDPAYKTQMLDALNAADDPILYFCDYGELRNGELVTTNKLLEVKRRLLAPLKDPAKQKSRKVRRRALAFGNSICCPSVTYLKERTPEDIFVASPYKTNLDWEAWADFADEEGSFVYNPQVLMAHRIHEESETSNLIRSGERSAEDLALLKRFWPAPIARALNHFYAGGIKSNSTDE